MAVDLAALADDLMAETEQLEVLLAGLDDAGWHRATPAPGWRVQEQVAHLAFFDEATTTAVVDPDRFDVERRAAIADPDGVVERVARIHRDRPPGEVHEWFRSARQAMLAAFAACDPSIRVPWYGPAMSPASSLTARIMETWAHGQDVADALGAVRSPTPALRHVAHLGVRTFANSFVARGLEVPDVVPMVRLRAPDGSTWVWGDDAGDVAESVEGDALDFCLVVTQRIHPADTGLVVRGSIASQWMQIAQAFAGAPGMGRARHSS